jgi:hypothetical protein
MPLHNQLKKVAASWISDIFKSLRLTLAKPDPFIPSPLLLSHHHFLLFSVLDNEQTAPSTNPHDESALPDWGIAVIVIGLGSFAFVLVFGITVVSKQPSTPSIQG